MENNNYNNNTNEAFANETSEFTVDQKVIAKISKKVIDKVDGVLDLQGGFLNSIASTISSNNQDSTAGIDIDVDGKNALVKANLILEYGKKAQDVFKQLDRAIKEEVLNLTGITVKAVKINIVDIMTREEFRKKNAEDTEE